MFGHPIGYIGSFSYNYGQEVRDDEVRSLIQPVGTTGFRPQNQSFGETVRNTVLWGGIANISTRIGTATKLSFNNTYNRTADNESIELAGENEEFNTDLPGHPAHVRRAQWSAPTSSPGNTCWVSVTWWIGRSRARS